MEMYTCEFNYQPYSSGSPLNIYIYMEMYTSEFNYQPYSTGSPLNIYIWRYRLVSSTTNHSTESPLKHGTKNTTSRLLIARLKRKKSS